MVGNCFILSQVDKDQWLKRIIFSFNDNRHLLTDAGNVISEKWDREAREDHILHLMFEFLLVNAFFFFFSFSI